MDRGAAVSLNLVCLGVRHLRVVAAALVDGVDELGHVLRLKVSWNPAIVRASADNLVW